MRRADRAAYEVLLDPTDPRYITGSDEDKARARAEWHQQRFVGQVMNSDLEEIPRSSLRFDRFGVIEDEQTGRRYRTCQGGLLDLDATTNVVAYYTDQAGNPVLLEPLAP